MKFRLFFGTLAILSLTFGVASAKVESAAEFLEVVQQRVDGGQVTAEEALLLKFQYAFDRDSLPADLQPTGLAPMKCGTPLMVELEQLRDSLGSETLAAIEGYLSPPNDPSLDLYISPSGIFRITYYRTGTHAVPLEDLNGNGIPDWVERMGEYADFSWNQTINVHGFRAPPVPSVFAYYDISIEELTGIYGYCTVVSSSTGMTRIVLHRNYIGFPNNDDPDGNQLGAAKATIAHEFKHASQYAGSRWSEGNQGAWLESDSTAMEEIVYPATNDYLNYLGSGSPISHPVQTLDGNYEDCVWQLHLSQIHGIPFLQQYWERRAANWGEAVMDSHEHMLTQYGTTLTATWNDFTAWNFASGVRWLAGSTYEEGNRYPTGGAQRTMLSYPNTYNGTVARLAANFIRCNNVDVAGQRLKITFNGAAGQRWTLAAVVNENYVENTGFYTLINLPSNSIEWTLPIDLTGIYSVGVVVGNANKLGLNQSYSITVELVPAGPNSVGDLPLVMAFAGNYPNPFNPSTNIKFTLSGHAHTELDIYDVSGRKVRALVRAGLDAGEHTIRWDGTDGHGRALPSGTYFAQLRSADQVASHKLVLAK